MREIGVSSPGGALACYLVRNGGKLDILDKDGEKPIDYVVDPKLKECLQKCLEIYRLEQCTFLLLVLFIGKDNMYSVILFI